MRSLKLLSTALVFALGSFSAQSAELAQFMNGVPGEIERYGSKLGTLDGTANWQVDFTGDGAPDRIASFGIVLGGNAVENRVFLFENVGGSFVPMHEVNVGGRIDSIVFEGGRLMFTVRVHKDGDPHCCPSGQKLVTHRP